MAGRCLLPSSALPHVELVIMPAARPLKVVVLAPQAEALKVFGACQDGLLAVQPHAVPCQVEGHERPTALQAGHPPRQRHPHC